MTSVLLHSVRVSCISLAQAAMTAIAGRGPCFDRCTPCSTLEALFCLLWCCHGVLLWKTTLHYRHAFLCTPHTQRSAGLAIILQGQRPPSEQLDMHGGNCADGATFEEAVSTLITNVLVPAGDRDHMHLHASLKCRWCSCFFSS